MLARLTDLLPQPIKIGRSSTVGLSTRKAVPGTRIQGTPPCSLGISRLLFPEAPLTHITCDSARRNQYVLLEAEAYSC